MKAVKIIIVALLIIIGLVLAVAFFLPSKVHTEMSMEISAPDHVVYHQVNTLKNWEKWTPFVTEEMIVEYNNIAHGVDASYNWKSEKDGNGTLSIIENAPHSFIKTSIEFEGQGSAQGTWDFVYAEGKTTVTWGLDMMELGWPLGRIFGLLAEANMKPYFTKGLTDLKDLCEKMPDYSAIKITEQKHVPSYTIKDSCKIMDIGQKMGELFTTLNGFLGKHKIVPTGPRYSLYHVWDPENYIVFEACIPADNSMAPKAPIGFAGVAPSKMVEYIHVGSYDELGQVHELIGSYLNNCGFTPAGPVMEEYLVDPMPAENSDPKNYQTRIAYPIL